MAAPSSYINSLPVEICVQILSSLDDVRCLEAAIRASAKFKTVLEDYHKSIIRSVLINCVGYDCLPEATMVKRCKPPRLSEPKNAFNSMTDQIVDELQGYVAEYLGSFDRPVVDSTTWTLEEAIEIGDFHEFSVRLFTEKFILYCQKTPFCELKESIQHRPVTDKERQRISRAFYRFELFRKLFGHLRRNEPAIFRTSVPFFEKFSPWETAQLGCIHDFLAHAICPGFNHVARYDPLWGAQYMVPFAKDVMDEEIQHLLTLGLEWVYVFNTLSHYQELERAVRRYGLPPAANHSFLYYVLDKINIHEQVHPRLINRPPFFDDGDTGAKEIWDLSLKAFERETHSTAVFDCLDWPYRRWGYVLWDRERLKWVGALDADFISARFPEENPEDVPPQIITASFKARLKKYGQYGLGTWASSFTPEPIPPPLRAARDAYPRSWHTDVVPIKRPKSPSEL